MYLPRLARPCLGAWRSQSQITFYRTMGNSTSSSQLLQSQEADFVRETVENNCVVVFSKTTCGYCRMAKRVFEDIGTPYTAIELNRRQDGGKLQDVLQAMTGGATVPRVFINGQCIGGGTETKKLQNSGQLLPMLDQCKGQKAASQSNL